MRWTFFSALFNNKRAQTKIEKLSQFAFSLCSTFFYLPLSLSLSQKKGSNPFSTGRKNKRRTKKPESSITKKLTMEQPTLTGGTVLLRSVSIFLSNRRQSKLLREQAQKIEKKKRTKTLSKLDEQMGKLQPKMLESLKRKTHFNKWVKVNKHRFSIEKRKIGLCDFLCDIKRKAHTNGFLCWSKLKESTNVWKRQQIFFWLLRMFTYLTRSAMNKFDLNQQSKKNIEFLHLHKCVK